MTDKAMPVLGDAQVKSLVEELAAAGSRLLVASIVDMAGVARAKSVPLARADTFHRVGVGVGPAWNVFCIDNAVAFTDRIGVVGDVRLRADLEAVAVLGAGYAWAPAEMFDQQGVPSAGCARGRLRSLQAEAEAQGIAALVGNELEFVFTCPDGSLIPNNRWQAYGLGALFEVEALVADLATSLEAVGVPVEQIHAEYGGHQFEVSFAPTTPLNAADRVVLARLVIGRVARRHNLLVSFSPQPVAGDAGNGAHQHLSLARAGVPLLSGSHGPYGMSADGAAAVGGIVLGLPELLGIFAGSVLSSSRLKPGKWSGAFACWGLENREAAVRFCAATPGNPHGANIELKCVDPSSNPYLTITTMLALALHGIAESIQLPPEVTCDPASLDPEEAGRAGIVRLAHTQGDALGYLRESKLAERILGSEIVSALLAVRTYELETYSNTAIEQLTEQFRFAWSS